MEFILNTHESLDNKFHTDLRIGGVNPSTIHGCYPTSEGISFLSVGGNKGKWYPTVEESIEGLKNNLRKEVRRLEGHGDLRPSQVRRLEVIKEFLNG